MNTPIIRVVTPKPTNRTISGMTQPPGPVVGDVVPVVVVVGEVNVVGEVVVVVVVIGSDFQ